MEDYKEDNVDDSSSNNNNNKRKRFSEEKSDESDSFELKLARVDSLDSENDNSVGAADVVDVCILDDSCGVNSPAAKRIQDDLLSSILDEYDPDPAIQGLDSVIKSFEEEILSPCKLPPAVVSDSGEQRPELGYLLEASDDELGLPPAFSAGNEKNVGEAVDLTTTGPETAVAFDNIGIGFDDGLLSDDPYKFGIGGDLENNSLFHEFYALGGGLFDSFEPAEISELAWRQESLSAS